MRATALLILLLFPSLALAQQQYYGSKAASINLPAPADPMDARLLTIHSGDIITVDNIRSSIQALFDTGHYRTISADAVAVPSGTDISFIVDLQCYFGTTRLDPADLLDRPITSYFPPPLGKKVSTATVDRLVSDTKELLEESGYFNAVITTDYPCDPVKRLATVVLHVKAAAERAKIRTIETNGSQQILTDSEIHNALKVSKGDDFTADKVEKGVARVRQKFVDKGYLTAKAEVSRTYDPAMNAVDLKISLEPGKTTVIHVSESGSTKSEISDTKLRTLVPIYEEGTVDADLVEEGRVNIEGFYKQLGYFDASAMGQESVEVDQSIHVEYVVMKGERHRVRSIQVEGNAFFTEAEILKKMKTSEGKSSSHGLFSPDLLANDVRVIQGMYRNAGFRSTVVTPNSTDVSSDIDITIHIREGLRSVLDSVTFTGNQSFPEPVLWREAGIQSDEVYSAAIIDNARDALANFYYKNGFSEVRIDAVFAFNDAEETVDVRFDITEGPKYRIGVIYVAGNTLTAEPVITRASGLKSYDPYNPETLLEAQQKLYAMGIFNRVEVVTIERSLETEKNLLIQVEEAKPILLTPGFGVTDRDGPRVTVELSDINWLGRAKTISARARGGHNTRQFQASYRDPRLFNHDLEGIASVRFDKTTHRRFNKDTQQDETLFISNESDFSVQTVRKLSKTRTLSFSASYETVNLEDIKANPNIGQFPEIRGLIQIARLGTSFISDRRDSVSDPTHGTLLTTTLEVANKHLGSEVNFVSLFTQGSYFTPARSGVIASSVRIGWKQPYGGDVLLPISERFFAGGSTTLRGFKFGEVGPTLGGELLTIGNVEYRVPLNFLPISNLGGAVFYDTGNVFENRSKFNVTQFTHSVGTGLRYKTPIGPVRIDVGFNLRPKPDVAETPDTPAKKGDRKYAIFFTLGHAF